jgi:hypothetical protein
VKEWIKKEINPPGMEKKRLGSLYTLTGRIFGIVKEDAEKSFNAFFPYLCDSKTLRKHGAALSVPELPYDTEEEYRNRVSAASFYLMRAGERGYIRERLAEHLGDRFAILEEFLRVRVRITDIRDKDRAWVRSFLDGTLDPNILLDIAELFDFIDRIPKPKCPVSLIVRPELEDLFSPPLEYNGAINYDGETVNDTIWVDSEYDGTSEYDGQLEYDGAREVARIREINTDFTYSAKALDTTDMAVRFSGFEDAAAPAGDSANMAVRLVGFEDAAAPAGDSADMAVRLGGFEEAVGAADSFTIGIRYEHDYDGSCGYDGSLGYNSMELEALEG